MAAAQGTTVLRQRVAVIAMQCFSSAYRVIAGIVIAAPVAASRYGGNNAGVPMGVIDEVRKDGSIIGTANGNIDGAASQLHARDGSHFHFDYFPGIIGM
jgi:hypothetical protein